MLTPQTLKELQNKQKELDNFIVQKKNLTDTDSKASFIRTKIALLVEIGELANELKTFKHWKSQKDINWEKAKEELIDCLHFYLSWSNSFGIDFSDYKFQQLLPEPDFNELLLALFSETESFGINAPGNQKIIIAEPPYKFQFGDKKLIGEVDRKTVEEEITRFTKRINNLGPQSKGYSTNKLYLENKVKKLQNLVSQSIGFLVRTDEDKNKASFYRWLIIFEELAQKMGMKSEEDVYKAYMAKNDKNWKRQNENY